MTSFLMQVGLPGLKANGTRGIWSHKKTLPDHHGKGAL